MAYDLAKITEMSVGLIKLIKRGNRIVSIERSVCAVRSNWETSDPISPLQGVAAVYFHQLYVCRALGTAAPFREHNVGVFDQ